jgi:hypothetical protein
MICAKIQVKVKGENCKNLDMDNLSLSHTTLIKELKIFKKTLKD